MLWPVFSSDPSQATCVCQVEFFGAKNVTAKWGGMFNCDSVAGIQTVQRPKLESDGSHWNHRCKLGLLQDMLSFSS